MTKTVRKEVMQRTHSKIFTRQFLVNLYISNTLKKIRQASVYYMDGTLLKVMDKYKYSQLVKQRDPKIFKSSKKRNWHNTVSLSATRYMENSETVNNSEKWLSHGCSSQSSIILCCYIEYQFETATLRQT